MYPKAAETLHTWYLYDTQQKHCSGIMLHVIVNCLIAFCQVLGNCYFEACQAIIKAKLPEGYAQVPQT